MTEQMDWRAMTPDDSPKGLPDVMADSAIIDLRTAKIATGDLAADFELPVYDFSSGTRVATDQTLRLLDVAAEHPVALIFGSYTWPPFRFQLGAIHDLAGKFGDRVAFYVVYIREAHPEDGWVMTMNRDDNIAIMDPTTQDERRVAASSCALRLEIRIPVVIDGMDDAVARAYGGWPDRLYLIGKGGPVAFQGEEGPFGFQPDQLQTAIEREIG